MRKGRAFALALILLIVCLIPVFADSTYPLDPSTVNAFDRLMMQPYNKNLDVAGDITSIVSMATPALFLALPSSEYLNVGVMYAETLALTYGSSVLLKSLFNRERPYMYFDGYPEKEVESGDSDKSFPSRHTAMAFASAAFTSYVFSKYYPDSEWRVPVIAASYSIAVATAALRIASGNHFATDVLAGALVGTAIGFGIPALHTLLADEHVEASASPFGLVFRISL